MNSCRMASIEALCAFLLPRRKKTIAAVKQNEDKYSITSETVDHRI